MRIVEWKLPIKAPRSRSLELNEIHFKEGNLNVTVTEEDTNRSWVLSFNSVQAFRVVTEECTDKLLGLLPTSGGLFELEDSLWIHELGRGEVDFLKRSRHFVICCYDEVIEVIAWDYAVKLLGKSVPGSRGTR